VDKALRLKNQSDEPVIDCRFAYHGGKSLSRAAGRRKADPHFLEYALHVRKRHSEDRVGRNHMIGAIAGLAGLRLV
jgi:hypothetical protein